MDAIKDGLEKLSPEQVFFCELIEAKFADFDRKFRMMYSKVDKAVDHEEDIRLIVKFLKENAEKTSIDLSLYSGRRLYMEDMVKELGITPAAIRKEINEGRLLAFKNKKLYTFRPNLLLYRVEHLATKEIPKELWPKAKVA